MRHSLPRRPRGGTLRAAARRARRNARLLATAAVVVAFIVALSLFVRSYSTGSDDTPHAAGAGATTPDAAAGVTPSTPAASSSAARRPAGGGTVTGAPSTLPKYTITPAEPGGFTYAAIPTHQLVLRATSARPIAGVGYLVPTSPDHSFGKALKLGTSWTVHTTVTGKPYYAALFIQADGTGTPITCTIELDGKVASRLTTSGPYGRQVCVA